MLRTAVGLLAACAAAAEVHLMAEVPLTAWKLYSSKDTATVYDVTVPCTIMGCLMQSGMFPNAYYGTNMTQLPTAPFDKSISWWFNTTVATPQVPAGGGLLLRFKGINYRANVWVNGVLVASNVTTAGAFRYFEFDVTQFAGDSSLAIAVELFKPDDASLPSTNKSLDLAITFVDWNPEPPDNSMGLWREVALLVRSGPVALRNVGINTTLSAAPAPPAAWPSMAAVPVATYGGPASVPAYPPLASTGITAAVDVSVQATNYGSVAVEGLLQGVFLAPTTGAVVANFTYPVSLAAGESRLVTVPAAAVISDPLLWWPWQMGPPQLYTLNVSFVITGRGASDSAATAVGLRETASGLNAQGNRFFTFNRLQLLLRGGGWSPDLFLRYDANRTWTQLVYARDMGLNIVRLEGKFEPDNFFDTCDRIGLLVLPGLCCCDAWQHWQWWGEEQYTISKASVADQMARLRAHPSVLSFMLSSDQLPPADVEQRYLDAAAEEMWPNPTVSAASAGVSNVTGPTGVKMSGPYSWVPPNYWLQDNGTQPWAIGGAWGFLTEGGPGENPMTVESVAATVPAASQWPPQPDNCWQHCGYDLGMFGYLTRFNGPLAARYGNATNLNQYLWRSHAAAYEGHKAMFEGYTRNKHVFSTGVVQWMLNNAWPSNIWHLFDWFLQPGPVYAATKSACEPLHALYGYDDDRVWLANSWYVSATGSGGAGYTVTADVYAVNGTRVGSWANSTVASIPADGAIAVLQLPSARDVGALLGTAAVTTDVYFVRLALSEQGTSAVVSTNTYWLSTSPDVLDWDASTWYNTPCSSYADYSGLHKLQPPALTVAVRTLNASFADVTVTNGNSSTGAVAFMVRLQVTSTAASPGVLAVTDVLPVQFSDNYFVLLPGEAKRVTATFSTQLPVDSLQVEVSNAQPFITEVTVGAD